MSSSKQSQERERLQRAYARRASTEYGDRYTHFNPGTLFTIQDRERAILAVLQQAGYSPLSGKEILEIGCGTGFWLRQFIHWGADSERVWGIELDTGRALEAQRRCPAQVRIIIADAATSPLPGASFDVVFQSTVFTSILDEDVRRALAAEMIRLVKPRGLILWYDFRYNNPWNPDVRGIDRTEIRTLFPGCQIKFHSLTLAPFLARAIAPVSWWMCQALNVIPLLRTHLLVVIRRYSYE